MTDRTIPRSPETRIHIEPSISLIRKYSMTLVTPSAMKYAASIMLRVMTPAMGWTRNMKPAAIAAKAIIVSCHGTPPSLKPLKALHPWLKATAIKSIPTMVSTANDAIRGIEREINPKSSMSPPIK